MLTEQYLSDVNVIPNKTVTYYREECGPEAMDWVRCFVFRINLHLTAHEQHQTSRLQAGEAARRVVLDAGGGAPGGDFAARQAQKAMPWRSRLMLLRGAPQSGKARGSSIAQLVSVQRGHATITVSHRLLMTRNLSSKMTRYYPQGITAKLLEGSRTEEQFISNTRSTVYHVPATAARLAIMAEAVYQAQEARRDLRG